MLRVLDFSAVYCVAVIENVFYMQTLIVWQLHKTDKLSKAWDQACDQGVVLLSIASVISIVSIWPWNNWGEPERAPH